MKLDIYHIDAFANQIFQGNPAAVCVLEKWLPDAIMQAIANEINLSETAFSVQRSDGDYRIRWFTPTTEVDLCGHATLATAYVLYEHKNHPKEPIRFHSRSGPLVAFCDELGICLNFPTQSCDPIDVNDAMEQAIGHPVNEAYSGEDLVLMLSDASQVEIMEPNISKLAQLPYRGICVTAPGNGSQYDFVCRFFAPKSGIDEDPVTGSAFTKLALIYALKLGKTEFYARQVSARGGDVHVTLQGNRVFISGLAQTVMHSTMTLPGF